MADKLNELEERIDRLDNKLKATFLEIEKRFESFRQEQPMSIEDRLQELEDLLLLVQLEVTKMRDRSTFLETSDVTPDVIERLNKLEKAVAAPHIAEPYPAETHEMRTAGAEGITEKLDEVEKRLNKLEKGVTHSIASEDILADVRKILHA